MIKKSPSTILLYHKKIHYNIHRITFRNNNIIGTYQTFINILYFNIAVKCIKHFYHKGVVWVRVE